MTLLLCIPYHIYADMSSMVRWAGAAAGLLKSSNTTVLLLHKQNQGFFVCVSCCRHVSFRQLAFGFFIFWGQREDGKELLVYYFCFLLSLL
jgi:hypothetical protein